MSFCILFILLSGGGYVTPDCLVDGVYVAPQDVVIVSHVPTPHQYTAWAAPHYYTEYYTPYGRYVRWDSYTYVGNSHRYYPHWHHQHRSHWRFWQPRRYKRQSRHRKYHRRSKQARRYKNYKATNYCFNAWLFFYY